MITIEKYNDNELLSMINEGSEEALSILCRQYKINISVFANKYYKVGKYKGLEFCDLTQEGLLGLNEAIKSFNPSKEVKFNTFANICIERAVRRILNQSNTNKNKFLNESTSWEYEDAKGNEVTLDYLVCDVNSNPENILLNFESENSIYKKAKEVLTILEEKIFWLRAQNFNNGEIASILDLPYKTIDNAMERIKKKLRE